MVKERKLVTMNGKRKPCPSCKKEMSPVEVFRRTNSGDSEIVGAVYECANCKTIRCPYCDVKVDKFNVAQGRQILTSNDAPRLGETKVLKCASCGTVQGVVGLFFDTLFPSVKLYEQKMRSAIRIVPIGLMVGLVCSGFHGTYFPGFSGVPALTTFALALVGFGIAAWGAVNWIFYSVKMAHVRKRRVRATITLQYEVDKGYLLDKKSATIEKELDGIAGKREVKIEL